ICDDAHHRLISAEQGGAQEGGDGTADGACRQGADDDQHEEKGEDRDERYQIDGEDLPSIALRQQAAAIETADRPQPFDDADRDGHQIHGQDDEAWNDKQREPERDNETIADRCAEHRQEAAETAIDGGAEAERLAADVLKGALDHRRLAECIEDEAENTEGDVGVEGLAADVRDVHLADIQALVVNQKLDQAGEGDNGAEEDVFRKALEKDREGSAENLSDTQSFAGGSEPWRRHIAHGASRL